MRRTLNQGWRRGLAIGGGIAIGDATYAAIAALGLTGVSHFLLSHDTPLRIAAGLFLIYLGLKTALTGPADHPAPLSAASSWSRDLSTSILLTLTNPPTIILFAALFTALAPSGGLATGTALATVAGVFSGSLLWWCLVVAIVSGVRHALSRAVRLWIDRIAGISLAGFGVAEVLRAVFARIGS